MSIKDLSEHALVQHKLTLIRDIRTGPKELRELLEEISILMAFEITRDMSLAEIEVETPLEKIKSKIMQGKKPVIIPILRAGLGMVNGMLKIIPVAKIGHIGLSRDPETLEAVKYYCKLPENLDQRVNIVVDPMLATGGSAVAAVNFIKEKGAKNIKFASLIAAPEGIETLTKAHSDIDIYCAKVDQKLNSKAYILPGLGDAGDRLFGTTH